MILEAIVTTVSPDGEVNIAPMGPRLLSPPDGELRRFLLRPFQTAQTYRNLVNHGEGVLHVTDDVLLLAQAALGLVGAASQAAPAAVWPRLTKEAPAAVWPGLRHEAPAAVWPGLRHEAPAPQPGASCLSPGHTTPSAAPAPQPGASCLSPGHTTPSAAPAPQPGASCLSPGHPGPPLLAGPPLRPAEQVRGWVLADCCRFYEFRIVSCDSRSERASLEAEVVHAGRVRDFFGLNRAKHAVVEAAILATRLGLLPRAEVEVEYRKLAVLVEKTGGPQEKQAFALLSDHVARAGPGGPP